MSQMPEIMQEAMQLIGKQDPDMAALLKLEDLRQAETLKLIPSENHASLPVRVALSLRTGDNYAEGYPGARYYQGQVHNDQIERMARDRIGKLFGVPHVNVQPYSGSPANYATEKALLEYGGTMMGLSLDAGGHLTHGSPVSLTGKDFRAVSYQVGPDGYIDYDRLKEQVLEDRPGLIVAGTTAYPRVLRWDLFREAADSVDAFLMADIAHIAGLVAGNAYPTPVPYADVVTFTGQKTFRGPRSGVIMVTQRGLDRDPKMGKKIDITVFPGLQGGPHINTIAALAMAASEASTPQFKDYASRVVENAQFMAGILQTAGINLVTGGTDSHLMLVDLRNKKILGNTVAEGLEKAGLVANRNAIPNDPENPRAFYPDGLRLGTPAVTSRGMGKLEMGKIAGWVTMIIDDLSSIKRGLEEVDETKKEGRNNIIDQSQQIPLVRSQVLDLAQQFPIPDTYI